MSFILSFGINVQGSHIDGIETIKNLLVNNEITFLCLTWILKVIRREVHTKIKAATELAS